MDVVSKGDHGLFAPRLLHQFPLPARRNGRQLVRPCLFPDLAGPKELMDGDEHSHRDQQEPKRRFDDLFVADEPGVLGDHCSEKVRHQQQEPDQKQLGFSSIRRRAGYLMLGGLSCMGLAPPEDCLSQVEVAEYEKPERRNAESRNHPPLRLAPFVLERISWFEERVSNEIPQSHVATIPEQLLEFSVDFLYREHPRLIRLRAGHGPPPARLRAGEPVARPPPLSSQPQTASQYSYSDPASWV